MEFEQLEQECNNKFKANHTSKGSDNGHQPRKRKKLFDSDSEDDNNDGDHLNHQHRHKQYTQNEQEDFQLP